MFLRRNTLFLRKKWARKTAVRIAVLGLVVGLTSLGRPSEAHGQERLSIEGRSGIAAGRLDEPIASFRIPLGLSPGGIATQYNIGVALLLKDEPEAALAAMQQESNEGLRLVGLALTYRALDQAAESDAALAELIEKYEQGWAYNIAYVLAFRGEADRAFEWLDKAVEYNDPDLVLITVVNEFANIHDDPRWLPFLESIGKSPEQLADQLVPGHEGGKRRLLSDVHRT